MRVHPDEAKAAGFESVEIADGSGDVYGLPVVFHNLHCLVSHLLLSLTHVNAQGKLINDLVVRTSSRDVSERLHRRS
jgi:hypothetical protein